VARATLKAVALDFLRKHLFALGAALNLLGILRRIDWLKGSKRPVRIAAPRLTLRA